MMFGLEEIGLAGLFIGDVFVVALGFYKCPAFWTIVLMLAGKAARFAAWTFLMA